MNGIILLQRGQSPSPNGDFAEVHDILRGVLTSVLLAIVVIWLTPYSLGLFKVLAVATLFYTVAVAVVK